MRKFPVLRSYISREQRKCCPESIPWKLVESHEERVMTNHHQSLERLAERGGLAPCEILAIVEDRRWKTMDIQDAIDKLRGLIIVEEAKQ